MSPNISEICVDQWNACTVTQYMVMVIMGVNPNQTMGGGVTPTLFFPTSNFFWGVPIAHHQPLWQATKKKMEKGPHCVGGELTWQKRVLISMNNHTTPKSWGGGGDIWYYVPPWKSWGGGDMSPLSPPIDAHDGNILYVLFSLIKLSFINLIHIDTTFTYMCSYWSWHWNVFFI